MLWYNTVSACGGTCNCSPDDLLPCNCRDFNCGVIDDITTSSDSVIIYVTFICVGIIIILFLLITLGFYLVYKYKKDIHPWKHAFKKSWPRWIIVSFVILGIGLYLHGIEMENLRNSR